jgi:hypothetical protein
MNIKEKLAGIPRINYINLFKSEERSVLLENELKTYNVEKVSRHMFDLYDNCVLRVEGPLTHILPKSHLGAITSHLIAIRKWLRETDEPYGIFCEDDLSLETVPYWNFTWNEFFDVLPEDWECVQLVQIQEMEFRRMQIQARGNYDWSACCYLLKREYAEKLINERIRDGIFYLETGDLVPYIEHSIFYGIGRVYAFPIFVENVSLPTSTALSDDFSEDEDQVNRGNHFKSYTNVIEWWKGEGKTKNIDELKYVNNF